jgi:hypothetical protein
VLSSTMRIEYDKAAYLYPWQAAAAPRRTGRRSATRKGFIACLHCQPFDLAGQYRRNYMLSPNVTRQHYRFRWTNLYKIVRITCVFDPSEDVRQNSIGTVSTIRTPERAAECGKRPDCAGWFVPPDRASVHIPQPSRRDE